MREPTPRQGSEPEIGERYDEYDVGETVVGVISDPENEHAWVGSNAVEPLES